MSNPDLILMYDDQSLTVYNSASKTVDLTGFSVGSASSRVSIDSWTAVASFDRTAFPAANCLEVRLINSEAPAYSKCRFVRSVIELSAIKLFWTQSTFTVTRGFKGGATLATCNPTAKRCDVKLS
jgi:hypothetical protein